MEVKINKEIQSYSESMFFGLSMRQCGFSLAAMLVAVGLYFLLKPYVGTETVSWMCILGAAPFAAMGPLNSWHGPGFVRNCWNQSGLFVSRMISTTNCWRTPSPTMKGRRIKIDEIHS